MAHVWHINQTLLHFRFLYPGFYTEHETTTTTTSISYVPLLLFAAIHHLKSSPTFSVRPCSSVGRVTVDLIRRSWVRFPPRSKDFSFASCGSLFPFTRANAQWVIHGFKLHYNLHFRVNSLFHYLSTVLVHRTIPPPPPHLKYRYQLIH